MKERPKKRPWLDKSRGLFIIGTLFLALGVVDGATNIEKYMKPSELTGTGVTLVLGSAVSKKKKVGSGNKREDEDDNDNEE